MGKGILTCWASWRGPMLGDVEIARSVGATATATTGRCSSDEPRRRASRENIVFERRDPRDHTAALRAVVAFPAEGRERSGSADARSVWSLERGRPYRGACRGSCSWRDDSDTARSGTNTESSSVEGRSGGELSADRRAANRSISVANRANADAHLFPVRGEHPQLPTDLHGRSTTSGRSGSDLYGHSIGHWEDDTLVVDTVGFNDKFWFDFRGHPHT